PPPPTSPRFPYTTLFRSYVFPVVTPGQYRITIETPGMQKYEAALTVQVQQSTTADAVMRVASEAVTVSVQDITPVTVTDKMSLGDRKSTRLNSSHEWISY